MSFLRLPHSHSPPLVFLFLSLSLFFTVSHLLPSISVSVSASAYNIIQTRYKYGLINPQHQTPLPNIVDGIEQHYILSNLPVNNTGEKLLTFTTLFTVNPEVTVTGQTHSIIIHVARPTVATNTDDDPLSITYIRSIRLDNIQSDRPISLINYNVELEKGDYIAVSVPNNAIFIRVGHNNVGRNIPYGVLSVIPGSSDTNRTGTFRTVLEGSTDTQFLQLCSGFTTYGSTDPDPNGGAESALVENTYFFWEPVSQYGELTKVSAIGVDFMGFGGDRGIETLDISVIVARPDPSNAGDLRYVPSSRRDFSSLADETWYDVTPPIQVQPGDVVGMISRGNSRFVTLRPFPTLDETRTYYSSIEIDGSGELLPQTKNYEPRFSFIIKADIQGDPQFAGFQGQSFQFHGLADEHFNLISSPSFQLNSHFVYLSSGRTCDYNDTLCFQHPGTYLDVLGFTIPSQQGDVEIKITAGAHADGLRIWMGQSGKDETSEIELGKFPHGLTWQMSNQTHEKATIKYTRFGMVHIRTPMFDIKVVNSDYFFNLELAVLDAEMLRVGARKHTISDHDTCHHDKHGHAHVNEEDDNSSSASASASASSSSHVTHDHGMVEAELMKKYHVDYKLHGLIGQTWRNVLVCGKHWMGSVGDYLVSSLFGGDYYYNFYSRTRTTTSQQSHQH